jgi:hypothetical protein
VQVGDVLRLPGLPLKVLLRVSERLLVGGGWEGLLVLLRVEGPGRPWKQVAVLGGCGAWRRQQQPCGHRDQRLTGALLFPSSLCGLS